MKKVFVVFLFCLVFSVVGCQKTPINEVYTTKQASTTQKKPQEDKQPGYYIQHDDTGYSLVIENSDTIPDPWGLIAPELYFSSVAEMYSTIKNGLLSTDQIEMIYQVFPKNNQGNVPLFDLDMVYEPIIPSALGRVETVSWHGVGYEVYHDNGIFSFLPFDKYQLTFETEYINCFDNWTILSQTTNDESGTTETICSSRLGKYKRIQYELEAVGVSWYVDELYALEGTNHPTSETTPYQITMYGSKNGVGFINCIMQPSKPISINTLSSCGIHLLSFESVK